METMGDLYPELSNIQTHELAAGTLCKLAETATKVETLMMVLKGFENKFASMNSQNLSEFSTLVWGLRNLSKWAENCNPSAWLLREPIRMLFHEGVQVFCRIPQTLSVDSLANRELTVPSPEEESLLEAFGIIFYNLDDQTLRDVFSKEIPQLHQLVSRYHPLLHLTRFFLACEESSTPFCDVMIPYLKGQMEMVGSSDAVECLILRRLFKDSFLSVAIHPRHNLQYLNLHINHIITRCLELYGSASQPSNYFELLLALFRSIGSVRCAALHDTISPLRKQLFETFKQMLQENPSESLYAQLALSMPSNIGHMLPFIDYVRDALVFSLQLKSTIVKVGMRVLKVFVDLAFRGQFNVVSVNEYRCAFCRLIGRLPTEPETLSMMGYVREESRKQLQAGPRSIGRLSRKSRFQSG